MKLTVTSREIPEERAPKDGLNFGKEENGITLIAKCYELHIVNNDVEPLQFEKMVINDQNEKVFNSPYAIQGSDGITKGLSFFFPREKNDLEVIKTGTKVETGRITLRFVNKIVEVRYEVTIDYDKYSAEDIDVKIEDITINE